MGLTGRIASGKGIVAEYFIKKEFIYTSLSKVIREEAKRRGIEETRKNLQDLGNLLREQQGAGIWARKIADKIDASKDYVIDGIRNPAEVREFMIFNDFYLISVDANQKLRYRRVVSRDKSSDKKTWEGFLEMDQRDFMEENPSGQQVGKCMHMADFHIVNDGSLEDFYGQIENIYQKIKNT